MIAAATAPVSICARIAALVREKGWSETEFATKARVNRSTAHRILNEPDYRIRNGTVAAAAEALGLTVHDLTEAPMEELIQRARGLSLQRLYEQAMQPRLVEWLTNHPDRAARLTDAELDELHSAFGQGGPITDEGIEAMLAIIERRRELVSKLCDLTSTHHLAAIETVIFAIWEQAQPYRGRDHETRADPNRRNR